MKIDVQKAVKAAMDYFRSLTDENENVKLTIEEVEYEDNFWNITLGVDNSFSISNKVGNYKTGSMFFSGGRQQKPYFKFLTLVA